MDSPSEKEEETLQEDQDQQNGEESSISEDTVDTEDSSNSEASEEESSTFDVVMDAIKPEDETEDEEESSSEEDDPESSDEASKDGEEEKEGETDEPSEEELKAWKPKTRKRFEDLQAKYRDVNERLEKAESEAGQFRQFTEFLDTNRISEDEANELFNIGALMKNDPLKALELITPHYQTLLQVTGSILPPDLQQQVEQGYITKENALELSRHRALGQTNKTIQDEQAQYQQSKEVNRQSETVNSMQSALATWEQQWSTSDPDYAKKKDRVLDRVELMLARASRSNELPQTIEQAVELANKAKMEVEAEIRQYRPKKQVQTVDGGSSSSSLPEPKDTRDVIRRTLTQ